MERYRVNQTPICNETPKAAVCIFFIKVLVFDGTESCTLPLIWTDSFDLVMEAKEQHIWTCQYCHNVSL